MKVLITGATGMIGQRLALRLLDRGHDLVIVSRRTQGIADRFPYPARVFAWDGSADFPREALDGVNGIINLAGEPISGGRWDSAVKKKKRIYDSRVEGTRRLVAAARDCASLQTFVSASAVGFYGDRGDDELTESSRPGEGFLADVCVDWEKAVTDGFEGTRVRTAVVRLGVVVAREGGILQRLLPLARLGILGPIGLGDQWMSWIHIDDVVELFVRALEDPALHGVLNGCSPSPVTNAEWSRVLLKSFVPWKAPAVPRWAARVALGEMSDIALMSQRALPRRTLDKGFQFRYPDLSTALSSELQFPKEEYFSCDQWVPGGLEQVFTYFSDERNLEELTPPFLSFQVLGKSTEKIQEGTRIDYRLKLRGIPLRWTSEIQSWRPPHFFVDTQVSGPYQHWYHEHHFRALKDGTLLRDRVFFRLPMGPIGRVTGNRTVRSDLEEIFSYRRQVIREKFGTGTIVA